MKRDYYSDFFFYPHELTKIVLQKFYKILLHQNALFGLANWTKKVFPVFPRNIPYRARPKTPPFHFVSALRDFFFRKKNFPQRVPPAFFLMFCDRMDVEKAQRVPPFSFFSALWDFFPKMTIFVFFNFFMFCDRMDVEKPQRVPPFSFSALWDFSASGARASEPRRATRSIFLSIYFFRKIFFQKISIFEYCKRVLDTWKSFCYFWALDMAPTWAGPGLFKTKTTFELTVIFCVVWENDLFGTKSIMNSIKYLAIVGLSMFENFENRKHSRSP